MTAQTTVTEPHPAGRSASTSPASTRTISVEGLKDVIPHQYRAWVRSAILASVLGYSLMTVAVAFGYSTRPLYLRQEVYALLLALVAFYVERRRNQPKAAAYLVLFAVAAETMLSFYSSSAGLQSGALSVLPVLVLGAGLFLGPGAAYSCALGTTLTAPLTVYVGGRMGAGPGFQEGDVVVLAAIVATQTATAYVLHQFLRSFGYLLARAEANERRAAELLEASPDGLIVLSSTGVIDSANDHAARALGVSRHRLLGMAPSDLPMHPVGETGGCLELEMLTDSVRPCEFLATHTGRSLEARARRVDSSEDNDSWLIFLRDTTERVRAREREQELAAQLQHSQKLEAVGLLAGGVAHDFNNLLTVVAGYADFIGDFSEEGASEIAEELQATYRRGVVLTRQLLAFARRDISAPVPLDLSLSLQGLEKLLHKLVGEQIRLEITCTDRCPIIADAGQLEQVIINLAANARDAMPKGGLLQIETRVEGDRAILRVTDTGVGIDPLTEERMFDPFFTTKPRGKGTGLGLSTVHGIVSRSSGKISVDSYPSEGTTFCISWPVTSKPVLVCGPSAPTEEKCEGRGLILLAEDDEHARKLIVRSLTEAGFEVLVAQDGAEALSLAVNLSRTPDLLLTDVVMPGMSGVELIERVTRMHPSLRYLVMSGYTDQQMTPAAFNISEDLIHKPFGRDELLSKVLAKLTAAPTVNRRSHTDELRLSDQRLSTIPPRGGARASAS